MIAKLDRLSRNLAFIATLMDSGVEFVATDNPHARDPWSNGLCAGLFHFIDLVQIAVVTHVLAIWTISFSK